MSLLKWKRASALCLAACLSLVSLSIPAEAAKKDKTNVISPLSDDTQRIVTKASKLMRSGKYGQASQLIESSLEGLNDVPKCLALAESTDAYGHPMNETRRACLNRALTLCVNNEEMLLVALKSRHYQFFEITRQCVSALIANSKTVSQLYELARKSHEVALNDVAHLAMEKAYTGIKDEQSAFAFAEQCKALGFEDLLRKVMKDLLDDEESPGPMCDVILRFEGYNMRDLTRYGLRKAMDNATTVEDMEAIFEVSRRLNEPDFANRAQYFVRKGKLIRKIKEDRAAYELQMRAWREGVLMDAKEAAERIKAGETSLPGTNPAKKEEPPPSGF